MKNKLKNVSFLMPLFNSDIQLLKRSLVSIYQQTYKGNIIVLGRQSKDSLYSKSMATFEEDTVYDQKDAEGFIKLNALRLKILKNRT